MRQLPVDEKGALVGVLTIKDLIEALSFLAAVAERRETESLSVGLGQAIRLSANEG